VDIVQVVLYCVLMTHNEGVLLLRNTFARISCIGSLKTPLSRRNGLKPYVCCVQYVQGISVH